MRTGDSGYGGGGADGACPWETREGREAKERGVGPATGSPSWSLQSLCEGVDATCFR